MLHISKETVVTEADIYLQRVAGSQNRFPVQGQVCRQEILGKLHAVGAQTVHKGFSNAGSNLLQYLQQILWQHIGITQLCKKRPCMAHIVMLQHNGRKLHHMLGEFFDGVTIADLMENPDAPFDEELLHEVGNASHRQFGTGFYFTQRPADPPGHVEYDRNADYIAKVLEVRENGVVLVEQKNKFTRGETLQWMAPGRVVDFTCGDMTDEEGNAIESAPHPKQRVLLPMPEGVCVGDFVRRSIK